ncbi:MAG: NAD(P)-dependent oxidoreductase [Aquabacterium sp.]|nr:NAD(P)-dependent oxidoreductase [Aquabacterium sp.]
MSQRYLLTGAAGWLGKGTLQALLQGIEGAPDLGVDHAGCHVRAVDVAPLDAQAAHPRVTALQGDVTHAADCRQWTAGFDGAVLIHTAGIIHPRRVADFERINTEGTMNVLRAAADAGFSRAVVVSSNSPIGCNASRESRFDESSPYNPYMGYGRSKMLMEQQALAFSRERGFPVTLIRAPWFYGPFQPPRQTLFFQMIRDGKAPIVGDGLNLRSMAYIDNLAQGLLLAATRSTPPQSIYWIADERPYTMNEIIDTVERLLETEFGQTCRHKRMRLPDVASEVAWVVDKTLQSAGIYHQKIHVLSEMNKTIACTVERAKRELGYRPTVALEEGMRRSLRWVINTYGRI